MSIDTVRIVANPLEFEGIQWDGNFDANVAAWLGRPFSAWKWDADTGNVSIELKFGKRRKNINKGDWILQTPENFIIVVSEANFEKRYSVIQDPSQKSEMTSLPQKVVSDSE